MKLCWKDRIIACCIILLYVIAFAILGKAFVAKVIVKHCGISNAITDFVMEGEDKQTESQNVAIDWKKLYPFEQEEEVSFQEKIEQKLNNSSKPEKRLTSWIRKNLWGYRTFVELKSNCDRWIGWNICRQSDFLVREIYKGVYAQIFPRVSEREKIKSMVDFQYFCNLQNIPFFFVQAPFKIDREMEHNYPELESFVNANADEIVNGLRAQGVQVLDIREQVEKTGLDNLNLFFKTDHHWTPETGLWASGLILEKLCEIFPLDFSYDQQIISLRNYNIKTYYGNFLGSHGRALTLGRAKPENIDLLYPKNDTDFTCIIPSKNISLRGDFSILYDLAQIQEGSYYERDSYAAYCYGDQAYMKVINHDSKVNRKKVLLIRDSFGRTIVPFLARATETLEIIDLRHFTGSIRNFIEQQQPDIIVVLYYPGTETADYSGQHSVEKIDWHSHRDAFDFR